MSRMISRRGALMFRCRLVMAFTLMLPATGWCDDYYHDGDKAGSLKTDGPLAVYDVRSDHLWNRLFTAFYVRSSYLPARTGGKPIKRLEGGDYIDFLAWGATTYWSSESTAARLNDLLDELLDTNGAKLIKDPLKRAMLLRDLWAPYDFLVDQNMRRVGSIEVRRRRDKLCRKLALVLQQLALTSGEVASLPDNYQRAIASGHFVKRADNVNNGDYLPPGLLTKPNEWVEIDFHQPDIHEDLYDRFITLHSREYRGRSYFRIFYRFPEGRAQATSYFKRLQEVGIDWKKAAQNGFILLKKDAPQIPKETEVVLAQFMMTLNKTLEPVPTPIVESIRHRTFRNVTGASTPETNTGVGMHVTEYTLKRRLLFDGLRRGGLQREPDDLPLYRVIFQPANAPDWGTDRRKVLFQQCADCHMSPRANRAGVHSMPSIVHMGGFNAGAQLGVAHALDPRKANTHGLRVARWKRQHETYRRLLEYLEK